MKDKVNKTSVPWQELDWSQLNQDKCPKCGKKLHLRKGDAIYNKNGTREVKFNDKIMACRSVNCDFTIYSNKLEWIKNKRREDAMKLLFGK